MDIERRADYKGGEEGRKKTLIYHGFYRFLTMVYKSFSSYLLCFRVFLEYLQDHECFRDIW